MASKKEFVTIPNPIYDVVFKFLMEDKECAHIVIETFLQRPVIDLTLTPRSHSYPTHEEEEAQVVRLFHLDFSAVIETPEGTQETVMIELQKLDSPSDILRFKRYVAKNYQRYTEKKVTTKNGKETTLKEPMRLFPIFILNFSIEEEKNDILIEVIPQQRAVFKDELLTKPAHFLEQLSFGVLAVQLPNIKHFEREKLPENLQKVYDLLNLFNQEHKLAGNDHRLRIQPENEKLVRLVKRLQSILLEHQDLEEQMHVEDEYINVLEERERQNAYLIEQIGKSEEARKKAEAEKQEAIEREQKAEKEKQAAIEREQKAEAERQKAEVEKQEAIERKQQAELEKTVFRLAFRQQLSHEQIAAQLEQPLDWVKKVLDE